MKGFLEKLTPELLMYFSLIVALAAMLGSLYFSEVLGYPPCVLCWYQRILMYPVVPIMFVAILVKDYKVYRYVLPLVLVGIAVGFYHVLLQEGIIPEDITNCSLGIPCKTEYFRVLRIVTIPFMSFVSFVVVSLSMYLLSLNKWDKNES